LEAGPPQAHSRATNGLLTGAALGNIKYRKQLASGLTDGLWLHTASEFMHVMSQEQ
jgi:hypothetical protein